MYRAPLLAFLVGCAQPVIGDGQLIEESRSVSSFSAIDTYGVNARIAVSPDAVAGDVVINTDSNLQALISTEVIDGTLRIEASPSIYPTELTALIVLPQLDMVGNYADADLWVTGLDGGALTLSASGNGHSELYGALDTLTINSAGGGVRNASELTAATVEINLSGSSTAWVTATDAIEGELTSAATLNVFGDPAKQAVIAHDSSEVIYY